MLHIQVQQMHPLQNSSHSLCLRISGLRGNRRLMMHGQEKISTQLRKDHFQARKWVLVIGNP